MWRSVARLRTGLEQCQRGIQLLGLAIAREGMTGVATRLYWKGGLAKVEIALARGRRRVRQARDIEGARRQAGAARGGDAGPEAVRARLKGAAPAHSPGARGRSTVVWASEACAVVMTSSMRDV